MLNDPPGPPRNGTRNWTAGFLPPTFQGTRFRPTGAPILNLKQQYDQPSAVTESARGLLNRLDEIHRRDLKQRGLLDSTPVMMRLRPTSKLRGSTSTEFTDADYAQHIHGLKKRLPGEDFHVVLEKPFVVVGNDSGETVQQHSTHTVQWAVNRLKKDYFTKEAIADQRVPAFKTLCSTTRHEFYEEDPGANYAQARYLCYYLQEQGLLVKFYHEFRENVASDPTGYKTLQNVLGTDDMDEFKQRWEACTAALRF